MKLIIFCFLTLLASATLYSQESSKIDSLVFRKNSVYLVCSGSVQKQALIAEHFNIADKNATHVGIGIMVDRDLTVYNVNNDSGANSALSAQNFHSFIESGDVRYWSIWEYKSTQKQIQKLKKLLVNQLAHKVEFDMDFDLSNNKLYCSEFCSNALRMWNPKKFAFQVTKKNLSSFYKRALNRDTLHYYPVDFFQVNAGFKKIYEYTR